MHFKELAWRVTAHLQLAQRQRLIHDGLGRLVDAFGDLGVEEMTPRLIEERLLSMTDLTRTTVCMYRIGLRNVFERAVSLGIVTSNPVLPSLRGPGGFKKRLERLNAIELLKRIEQGTEPLERLRRDAESIVRRTAGDEAADAVHLLMGLGSPRSGPRSELSRRGQESAVLYLAQHPEATDYQVEKNCPGTERHEIKKWRRSEQFQARVRRARGEELTEEDIRVINTKLRRKASNEKMWERNRESLIRSLKWSPQSRPKRTKALEKGWVRRKARQQLLSQGHQQAHVDVALRLIRRRFDYAGIAPSSPDDFLAAFEEMMADPLAAAEVRRTAEIEARVEKPPSKNADVA
jgi:hypothetical protein